VAAPTWRGIIKVGVVASYSGAAPTDGLSLLAGARLAADDLNRAGGVGGYRLEIVAPDEANPSSPRDLAVDPDVIGVVGHLGPDGRAASDVYREAGLAWLAAEPVDPGTVGTR
jgi:branched-chain amino acid transport system substrate-binding protein